jgi:hypothetical protein
MSEMTLFKSGSALPDYLRGVSDDFTKSLAGGSGGKTISIKGGVFRMIVGGEEIAKNEERGMNLVFVAAAPAVGRTYYAGVYEEGVSTSPACWSADGKTPDATIERPQAGACALCPQNIKGSGQGESRACRFSRRFAVVLEGDIGGNVYRLQLPATSLFGEVKNDKMPMTAYAKFLSGHQVPMSGIVTEARFDTGAAVPVLQFRAVRPLTKDELAVARAQATSEDAQQAVEVKFAAAGTTGSGAPLPALPAAFQEASAQEAAPTKRPSKKADGPATPTKDVAQIMSEWASDDDA